MTPNLPSSHLHKAIRCWLEAGHTQVDLRKITGLNQAVVSRYVTGDRGFSDQAFAQLFSGFRRTDFQQAIIFLLAWLRDHTPEEAESLIAILPRETLTTTIPCDNLERAFTWIRDHYRTDPTVAEFILSGWDLAHSRWTSKDPSTPEALAFATTAATASILREDPPQPSAQPTPEQQPVNYKDAVKKPRKS